ncbi:hypothetical protein NEOLI_003239 [Neolecta irregularis DAH-3]|uniref:Hyaluronan/mRNA-binding protein domain-containing protein n=1 Tax=Neolecta irregularis (strain DAH-3) TaxID=1198029 RepID=A0A1U7LS40_NEOID|nr:hypothetical protein NEOLI_003239 [Neolecta irregularis DAH-3]|eukprot:OLL25485.1 hypothetical protein NEOLI_003239 [Neolecta irregularis DAH-3]
MSVVSKNLFDLLGNDSDAEQASTKAVPKETVLITSTKKRDSTRVNPSERTARGAYPARGSARGPSLSGNEAAFRDREAGSSANRDKPVDERSRGRGRGRGSRGGRGRDFDRRSGSGHIDTDKSVRQGWGDESTAQQDGENIASDDKKTERAEGASDSAAPAVEEDRSKTLDEYLAERAEKAAVISRTLEARRANEGTDESKWKDAVELTRDDSETKESYFAARQKTSAGRARQRKEKVVVDIDPSLPRRGRGNARGGQRGSGRSSNKPHDSNTVNLQDQSAFPSLGA